MVPPKRAAVRHGQQRDAQLPASRVEAVLRACVYLFWVVWPNVVCVCEPASIALR